MSVSFENEHDDGMDAAVEEKGIIQDEGVFNPLTNPKLSFNWVDITEEFTRMARTLSLGELLHDEHFGLFEAMSAIEMMDPKMDAGMMCNRGDKPILTYEKAVETGALRLEGFTLSEQIGIIDQTLACMVSWLEGHSLAQTVFTNLYLHKPFSVEDRPLKAFCIATYKLVEVIKHFIDQAAVFEEEDYQSLEYGYRLLPDVSEPRTIGMLKEVEEELLRRLRQRPPQPEVDQINALAARARFTRLLLSVLFTLSRQESSPEARVELRPDSEVHKALNVCAEQLALMQRTVSLGVQGENSEASMLGFEPLVNQRLLPPTFPRYSKIRSREEAFTYYEEFIQRLKVVCKIYSHISFHSALDFFIDFSRHNPCILSRSILQVLYMPQPSCLLGTTPLAEVLRDAAKNFICPPALVSRTMLSSNAQARLFVETFLLRCGRPFVQLIQLCGHNRARQRDKLAHLLEDFSALQDEAERVDAYLHDLSSKSENQRSHLACFGTWILYHTLRIMVMYLLSGFELELYSVHEYHYIYWYLYEFLYGWLVSSLSRADSFLMEQETLEAARGKGKKNKVRRKKGGRPFGKDITLCQVYQNLCGGYYKATVGFHRTGKVNFPKAQFDCERVRYEHRFQPFSNLLTPPPMQYSEFRDMTTAMVVQMCAQEDGHSPDYHRLFMAACKNFHQARTLLETIQSPDQEVNDLLRVAKTNFVVLKLLAGGHKKDSKVPPLFDFSQHCHFPIIKLV